jgi:hypothetical protein
MMRIGNEAMLKLFANAAIAGTLMLSVSAAAPAWSAGKPAASHAKCPNSKHKHAARVAAPAKAAPARGVMLVEHRKQDIQILSFGP